MDGEADLKYVAAASESVAKAMKKPLVVVNKSTVPVGTGDWVANIIRENQAEPISFSVVSCPEFLREGSAILDFMNPAQDQEIQVDTFKKVETEAFERVIVYKTLFGHVLEAK